MSLADGINLVRWRLQEERNGITQSPTSVRYHQALASYPATMAIAHHLLALEERSTMPQLE